MRKFEDGSVQLDKWEWIALIELGVGSWTTDQIQQKAKQIQRNSFTRLWFTLKYIIKRVKIREVGVRG